MSQARNSSNSSAQPPALSPDLVQKIGFAGDHVKMRVIDSARNASQRGSTFIIQSNGINGFRSVVFARYLMPLDVLNWLDLLRFLSSDAKIPLSTAMAYAKSLSSAKLTRYDILTMLMIQCESHCRAQKGRSR
jgi:hypothetical protein